MRVSANTASPAAARSWSRAGTREDVPADVFQVDNESARHASLDIVADVFAGPLSLGGLHAAYTGAHRSSVFGMAAIYSPYFRAHPQVLADFTASERLPLQVFMMQGIYDFDVTNMRQLRNFLQEEGYALEYIETSESLTGG